MNADEFKRLFPNASGSCIAANLSAAGPGEVAVVEHGVAPVALATNPIQKGNPARVLVSFVSVRKRLIDPDNLCEKFLLDCLRYCRAISGDEPDAIALSTTQRKAEEGEAEHTEITVYALP